MNLYDIAIAKKLSGGGGGGGGGDFYTAEATLKLAVGSTTKTVTIACYEETNLTYVTAVPFDANGGLEIDEQSTLKSVTVTEDTTVKYGVLKEHHFFMLNFNDANEKFAVAGNAEVSTTSIQGTSCNIVKVFGDCTITIGDDK